MKWHQIENTNYEISENGEVRNLKTKELKKLNSGGTSVYLLVQIYICNGKRKNYLIHRLVAKYFVDNPENKSQVNHIDKNKLNNNYSNLEWVTPKENMEHHYKTGGIKRNNQTYKGKFGKDHNRSVQVICNNVIYNSMSEASKKTGIPISTIYYSISMNKPLKSGMHFQLANI
jgi:hypothetical protein